MSHFGVVEGMFAGNFAVEISNDAVTWRAVSNATVKIDDVELSRPSGEAYVGGSSDFATVTIGKREPVEITLTFLFNEAASDVAYTLLDRFHTNPRLAVRWAPKGLATGNRVFATSADGVLTGTGVITGFTFSSLDPSDAEPYVVMCTVRSPTIRQYYIQTSNPTDLSG